MGHKCRNWLQNCLRKDSSEPDRRTGHPEKVGTKHVTSKALPRNYFRWLSKTHKIKDDDMKPKAPSYLTTQGPKTYGLADQSGKVSRVTRDQPGPVDRSKEHCPTFGKEHGFEWEHNQRLLGGIAWGYDPRAGHIFADHIGTHGFIDHCHQKASEVGASATK